MNTLTVDLGQRSYPIHIGPGLLGRAGVLDPYIQGRQVLAVTNDVVAPLYLDALQQHLTGHEHDSLILPDGEEYKTLDTVNLIFDRLLQNRYDRSATLIALGGGVIGDITGFAAACYQRGVNFIQVPTTLLAQVDSSVGGKTGVNHPLGKNMIGAFYQPLCVLADTDTLNTLDARQLSAGLAEVIKYGLIRDAGFFDWLEQNLQALLARDADALAYAIERSCRNKAEVVAADEREAGVRALLNLGHTFGHAIETGMGYGAWLHGEAVAAGMAMAADMSARMGWLDGAEVEKIDRILAAAGLPARAPSELDAGRMHQLMAVDKKVSAGTIRLVLLRAIGDAVLTGDYDEAALVSTLEHCRATAEP